MWYAVGILSGLVIDSSDDQRGRRYRCPRCRADAHFRGGRVRRHTLPTTRARATNCATSIPPDQGPAAARTPRL